MCPVDVRPSPHCAPDSFPPVSGCLSVTAQTSAPPSTLRPGCCLAPSPAPAPPCLASYPATSRCSPPRRSWAPPWRSWVLAFCDERLVPVEDPESTYGAYKTHLLSKISIPENQVVIINPSLPVEEAASDYAEKLKEAFQGENMPVFDLLILGIGPDGHTCSLFPDHPLLQEKEKIVASISDSPKPPPERITLTLPVLNAARTVVFVATGESKAAILKRILEGDEENPLPAALVQPHTGKLHWFLDESAAKELTVPFEKHSIL
ncbi:6-phosphogluconolactonase isoform X1 [Trachemys scripta elegans]|uniref:6-phosphogluconolactonase isoform X1 n=1 Tax=Trachemys scripta elegans TaxID=31138 RepID=UPI001555B9D1|nr:6-phosphogluconolactonase isoform X1 [Trachemys scripta elegans]